MGSVVVVYVQTQTPLRTSIEDRLAAYSKHGEHDVTYVNVLVPGAGRVLRLLRPDLVVVDTTVLDTRFSNRIWPSVRKRLAALEDRRCAKVLLPQDEYFQSDAVVELARAMRANLLCSVAPETEWNLLYGEILGHCKVVRVLTGYLDDGTVRHVDTLRNQIPRNADVGYRAWRAESFLGRQGQLKVEIGVRVAAAAPLHGLSADIVLQHWGENLLGDAWWRWLIASRWVIGVEGGASILDRDGSLRDITRRYLARNPRATFEEVEASCFPGRDGELDFRALSPRHLEACVTRTGQILIEGDYNGILRPWDHYLPLKRDFSNLDEILELSKNEELRTEIVARAFQDVVETKVADYSVFASTVFSPLPLFLEQRRSDRSGTRHVVGAFNVWSRGWVLGRSYLRKVVLSVRRVLRQLREWRTSRNASS